MTQLNINVSRTDRERFDSYAAEFGLDRTGLANLLLYRELRVARLDSIDIGRVKNGGRRQARITAHLPDERWEEFVARAQSLNVSRSVAGAAILLSELDVPWLKKAVEK